MLCNLPEDLIRRKIQRLHDAIMQNMGSAPTSFRAGRWGYGPHVARVLLELGYRVDSSIMALTSWDNALGPDTSDISSMPYYFHPTDIFKPDPTGTILEVPATVLFLQHNEARAKAMARLLGCVPRLHLTGVLGRLGLLNKGHLSPEICTGAEMVRLAKTAITRNLPVVNLFFHSSTLCPGLTPFVRNAANLSEFLNRIRTLLQFAHEAGIESIRLSDVPSVVPRCA